MTEPGAFASTNCSRYRILFCAAGILAFALSAGSLWAANDDGISGSSTTSADSSVTNEAVASPAASVSPGAKASPAAEPNGAATRTPGRKASQQRNARGNIVEIPQANPSATPKFKVEGDPVADREIRAYQTQQDGGVFGGGGRVGSLRQYTAEAGVSSPIGVELREDTGKLADGEKIAGLAIITVKAASPAAVAGLHPYSTMTHDVIEGASVAAAFFFPPAILAVTVLDQARLGESFDLIIGVDGKRVSNVIDFDDQMRLAHPGDRVYLSVLRDGARLQIPVDVPRE